MAFPMTGSLSLGCPAISKRLRLLNILQNMAIPLLPILKNRVSFPLNILPVPKPYYFHLYDIETNHIYDLAWSCNDFLMFEMFVADRESIGKIGKEKFLKSEETLYTDFESVKKRCEQYFFAVLILTTLISKAVSVG